MTLNPAQVAPKDMFDEAVSQIGKNTINGLFPLWMDNWQANLQEARKGDSLDKLYSKAASERVLVVGRGPSIFKHGHLDLLAKHPFQGHIVASDGALPLLAERGITPYLSMTVDGNPIIAKWFEVDNIKVRAVLPLTVHPKTVAQVKSIGGHIFWYIPELDAEPMKGVTETLQLQTYSPQNPTGISKANGAGCCGNAAIILASSILRAREIIMIGMDSGYHIDTPMEQLHYHDGLMKACGYDEKATANLYRMYYSPPTKEFTIVDPIFETYRLVANSIFQALNKAGVRVVNCSQGGCLYPEGVKAMSFRDYLLASR